uniref:Uncharacterized protein n=1 Tax=Arundo donax TaxID=35708 RepID=A0A0A8ZPC8_ARUDO
MSLASSPQYLVLRLSLGSMTDKRWLHQANSICFSPIKKNLHSISLTRV